MRILIDPDRLEDLGGRHHSAAQDLGGLAATIARRAAESPFDALLPYGVPTRELRQRTAVAIADLRGLARQLDDVAEDLRRNAARARWLEAGSGYAALEHVWLAGRFGVSGVVADAAGDLFDVVSNGTRSWAGRTWLKRLGNMTLTELDAKSARWKVDGHYWKASSAGLGLLAVGGRVVGRAVDGPAGALTELAGLGAEGALLARDANALRAIQQGVGIAKGASIRPAAGAFGVVVGTLAVASDVGHIAYSGWTAREGWTLGSDLASSAGSALMMAPAPPLQAVGLGLTGVSLAIRGGLWLADNHDEIESAAKNVWDEISSAWRKPASLLAGSA